MAGSFVAEHHREVLAAATRIADRVRRTPLLPTDLGDSLWVKAENLQVTGSFKVRGAHNAILCALQRDPALRGVVCVSSGNHAQAVAHAARLAGIAAVCVIPEGAVAAKVAATRELGAEVVQDGVTMATRGDVGLRLSAERGFPLVHPFDDWDVIHGQGTAALEILRDLPATACVVTPVGGGGLLSGTAIALRGAGFTGRIVGVEPALAADARDSFVSGEHRRLDGIPATVADGARVLSIGERAFECLVRQRLVDDIVAVDEADIVEAVLTAWRRLRLVVEPTGALSLAAWLSGMVPAGTGAAPTVCLLSGGNVEVPPAAC